MAIFLYNIKIDRKEDFECFHEKMINFWCNSFSKNTYFIITQYIQVSQHKHIQIYQLKTKEWKIKYESENHGDSNYYKKKTYKTEANG